MANAADATKKAGHNVCVQDGAAVWTEEGIRATYPLLSSIHGPADVKALPEADVPALCEEIRRCLVDTVRQNGGHLASNLGVV